MRALPFFTVDVFTEVRFGGNPLAVVMADDTLGDATMQALAAEFNLSETTFVLPPEDAANTARVRIFNRRREMAFAGHPMVGTAFVLASQQPRLTAATFEVPAGVVGVSVERAVDGAPITTTVAAPQPLSVGATIAPDAIARTLGLAPSDVVTASHLPIVVSNGTPYIIAELTSDALASCEPDLAAFRAELDAHPHLGDRFSVHVYCKERGALRARMFAPLAGTWEDPATGSANTPLACFLLALQPETTEVSFLIHQGFEMGRPSVLYVEAKRAPGGIVATLRGGCVSVMRGEITL